MFSYILLLSRPLELIKNKISNWIDQGIELLPNLIVGIFVLIIFYFLAKLIRKLSFKFIGRLIDPNSSLNLIGNLISTVVFVTGIFIVLELLQLSKAVTTLLAGAGILGLALSFAFQDIAQNFVSGILLIIRKPFRVGHIIKTNEFFGIVSDIDLRNTVIKTFEGQDVLIPNRKVFENPIINYSLSGNRRIDLAVGISYGEDLNKVEQVTKEAVLSIPEILKKFDILFNYEEFGNSSINFKVRFWIKYDKGHQEYLAGLHNSIMAIKKAYDENDIMIPFPIRTLDFGIKDGKTLTEILQESQNKGN